MTVLLDTRRQQIVNVLTENGALSIEALAEHLGVSPATVRRDLAALTSSGHLRRIRGGAEIAPSAGALRDARVFDQVSSVNGGHKDRIARAAAGLVQPGQTVILANGTTTFRMAEHLAPMDVHVATYSLPVVFALQSARCGLAVLGGFLYRGQGAILTGGDDQLSDLNAVFFFVGAHSVDGHGSRETDPLLVSVERRMASRALKTVLLVDSSKFEQPSGLLSLPMERIDAVITDTRISADMRAMLEARVQTVMVV